MRRLSQFSLRSLLLLVTAVCLFIGYEMNWIHRRRHFNAVQRGVVASDDYLAAQVNSFAHANSNINVGPEISGGQVRPPGCLGWFGEKGYGSITVIVPMRDATRLKAKDVNPRGFRPYYIWNVQKDYRTAQRLFPEARVFFAYTDTATPDGFVAVFVRDKESGRYRVDSRLIEEQSLN